MKLTSLIFLLLISGKIFGQYQTVTTGGTATGSGGSVTYTIGLPLYTNQAGSGITLLQGNQQPREFLTVSYQSHNLDLGIKIFPNPAVSYFYIQIGSKNLSNMSYKLTTLDGKLISEEKFTESITLVNVKDYAEGIYFLQLFSESELISSTKIIKINY